MKGHVITGRAREEDSRRKGQERGGKSVGEEQDRKTTDLAVDGRLRERGANRDGDGDLGGCAKLD